MAQLSGVGLGIERLLVRGSPKALLCVLEQDTFLFAKFLASWLETRTK